MVKNNRRFVDQLGIITSGLCAVHCAAIPILLSFGLISGINSGIHGTAEWIIIVTSTILGVWSIYNGIRGHGRLAPQLMIGIGAFIIIIGLLYANIGHAVMAMGGCLLLIGHWLNWRGRILKVPPTLTNRPPTLSRRYS